MLLAASACGELACSSSFSDRDACVKLGNLMSEQGYPVDSPDACAQRVKARRSRVGDKEVEAEKQCIKKNDTVMSIEACLLKQMESNSEPDVA